MNVKLIAAIALFLVPTLAHAQPSDNPALATINNFINNPGSFREIDDDFLVPSSPAFAILGVSPENVIRPSTPKEFGTALLNGVDPSGTLQNGIAIEFSPHIVFDTGKLSLDEYQNNKWRRLLARSQISIATTRAASDDDDALRFALGFRTVLFDKSDVRSNKKIKTFSDRQLATLGNQALEVAAQINSITQCIGFIENFSEAKVYLEAIERKDCAPLPEQFVGRISESTNFNNDPKSRQLRQELIATLTAQLEQARTQSSQTLEQQRAAIQQAWNKELKEFRESAWNATNVTVGGALTLSSEDGQIGNLGEAGYAVYLTAGYGFEGWAGGLDDNAHLIGQVRYQTNELVTATEDNVAPFLQDTLTLGGQLRIRGPELGSGKFGRNLHFFGDINYIRAEPQDRERDTSIRYAVGADIRITDNASFQISVGEETGSEFSRDASFVLGDLKWSF